MSERATVDPVSTVRPIKGASAPVFLSITTPHLPRQSDFVDAVTSTLRAHALDPYTLGRMDWSYDAPLVPIRALMRKCRGTVVIAMARTHVQSGLEWIEGDQQSEFRDRYLSTAWTQIEAAMAYQVGHPLLVLREERVAAEGLLNPANSGLSVHEFNFAPEGGVQMSSELDRLVADFSQRVARHSDQLSRG